MATNGSEETTTVPNSDSQVSVYLQEPDEVQKVFSRFDANGDGRISVNEIGNVMEALGTSYTEEELQRVMEDLDTDRDGFINLTEFDAFCKSGFSEDGGLSELREAFALYDQNKNGLISENELHMVLNRLGMTYTLDECRRMIQTVDSDGDGHVNFAEFEKMMSNNNGTSTAKNGV